MSDVPVIYKAIDFSYEVTVTGVPFSASLKVGVTLLFDVKLFFRQISGLLSAGFS